MKMVQLRRLLRKAGWECRPGKGSHEIWTNPTTPHQCLVLARSDNDDVPPYLLAQWKQFHKGCK